ncbi:alpha/beta fold hydrolase [Chryseobacterium sp. BIGb0232]|uniref:alpha/beta fold hydrolase n=1 Tax=Chryseobacterium sp. BIGb0232 TaxID=2940598 RepID=UPI000F48C1A0|nr:alpha/beta fold hydrolase [Chryseobacterium sp. BIGb0232]MCS4304889.1 alpha-beta hydrolase superfamily lysophospholipase [Chryseobacterium sp. BIGb0232]ROS09691.1 alpha-beta hydrolase superfamily lysophospholipase [Chryseobacterium nakagawai]
MSRFKTSAYLSSKANSKSHLFCNLFAPDTPKATLLIVHGMQEHSGRYAEIAEYFANHGIAVLTYDHLGHGKSVKEKKDIGFFQLEKPDERLIADAEMMADHLAAQYPDVPHFILGHSMGSFITRCLLQKASHKFAGAIITGTGGPLPGIALLRGYLSLANAIAPRHRTFLNSVFTKVNNKHFKDDKDFGDTSWLSVNPKNRKNFEQDELCGIPFTHNAFYTLFTVYKRATSRDWATAISPSFPFLFVSGQNDPIGDFSKGVMVTVNNLKADGFQDVNVKIYPEMRHEILNEEIWEQVLNGIYDWILKHCK